MDLNRRALIGAAMTAGAALGLTRVVGAAPAPAAPGIDLWPGPPPGPGGASGPERLEKGAVSNVSRPRMRVYRPASANGRAMLVMSGGGYAQIQLANESTPACLLLARQGYTAFELIYRLPADGWPPEAPFADAQRAMRLIRAQAAGYAFAAPDVGILGFSAGGHLAGMTATNPDALRYQPVDAADGQSARPILAGLIYPIITLEAPFDVTRSGRELIGRDPTPAESASWSVQTHVDGMTPPTFLAQAADDPIAPIDNSLVMFAALRTADVPREMHIFEQGGHGWGIGKPGLRSRRLAQPVLAFHRNEIERLDTREAAASEASRVSSRPSEGWGPGGRRASKAAWMPAFAGMTGDAIGMVDEWIAPGDIPHDA